MSEDGSRYALSGSVIGKYSTSAGAVSGTTSRTSALALAVLAALRCWVRSASLRLCSWTAAQILAPSLVVNTKSPSPVSHDLPDSKWNLSPSLP